MQDQPDLPSGFRYIRHGDASKGLKSFVSQMDRYTLDDYYRWSRDDNSLAIIREVEEEIAAIALVTVQDDCLMIEMLARNKLHPYIGSAGDLMVLVEKIIAPHFGKNEIRLEAMEQVVGYYGTRGYDVYGRPYRDAEWGDLTPMRKRLAP